MSWEYKLLIASLFFLGFTLLSQYKNPIIEAIRNCQMIENTKYEERWNEMCAEIGVKWGDCLVPVAIQQAKGVSWDDHLQREAACENQGQ